MIRLRLFAVVSLFIFLVGCSDGAVDFRDLDEYITEARSRPTGKIEPLPEFRSYEVFTYSASAKRSPFQPPIKVKHNLDNASSNIKPDDSRAREYLEQFEIDSFSMVGSISNEAGLWGLVRGEDGIHRVKVGDYLGRNHGRITFIDSSEMRVMEIVPAGPGFWVERPRAIRINE